MLALLVGLVSLSLLPSLPAAAPVPTFTLDARTSTKPGVEIPALLLGTGPPGTTPASGDCWQYPGSASARYYNKTYADCGNVSVVSTSTWLSLGGTGIDTASTYLDETGIALGLKQSSVARADVFITSKVGPYWPLGYEDTLVQFKSIQEDFGDAAFVVDLLLIHWPSGGGKSTDPECRPGGNATSCRISTWKAMLHILDTGGARAVGVSNYQPEHFDEIKAAGLRLPAVTQNSFSPKKSNSTAAARAYCQAHGIHFQAYSPLGAPYHGGGLLVDPTVKKIAKAHSVSTAQVLLNWQYAGGHSAASLTSNPAYMKENLASYDFTMTDAEMASLAALG